MIYVRLNTPCARLDEASFNKIWHVLGQQPLRAKKWGDVEPVDKSFDGAAGDAGFEMLRNRGVIVEGDGGGVSINDRPTGVTTWRFRLDDEVEDADVVEFCKRLSECVPIVFGSACTQAEYDAKHKVVKEHSYGWKGTSMWDFQEFLSGVYWLTLFGDHLRTSLDFAGLEDVADLKLTEIGHGGLMVQLDEPLAADDLTARLDIEHEIASHLGGEHFFDRERRDDEEFAHPPEFRNYLSELEDEYRQM